MLSALTLSLTLSAAAFVPPGELVEDHSQPWHWTQPTIRTFERREVDHDRRLSWEAYVLELDRLWSEYRAAGSTPRAFREYREAAAQAKRRYVFRDPYYAPIVTEPYFDR